MIFVWGERYIGRKNHVHVHSSCKNCDYHGPMNCYHTTNYFTIYFLPVSPLGVRRVFNECPKCKNGLILDKKQYNQLVETEMPQALQQARQDPANPQAIERVLGLSYTLQDQDAFAEAIVLYETHGQPSAQMHERIASLYAYFGEFDQAEQVYQRARKLDDAVALKVAHCWHRIMFGNPLDAHDDVKQLLKSHGQEATAVVAGYITALHEHGRTAEAQQMFDRLATAFPENMPKELKQLGKSLTKAPKPRPRVTPVTASSSAPMRGMANAQASAVNGPIKQWFPVQGMLMAVGLIVACVFGLLLLIESQQQPQVYLTNGLNQPVPVRVNGQPYTLRPLGNMPMDVGYGTIQVEADGAVDFAPVSFDIDKEHLLLGGLLDDRLHVINPDASAIMLRNKEFYAQIVSRAPEPQMELRTGQQLHVFRDVDSVMRDNPNQINTKRNTESRVSVKPITHELIEDNVYMLSDHADPQLVAAYLQAVHPHIDDTDLTAIGLVAAWLEPEQAERVMRQHLDSQPVKVNWHRVYQQYMLTPETVDQLTTAYRQRLADEPDEGAWSYLLGRLEPSIKTSSKLHQQAIDAKKPCHFGLLGLAHHQINQGNYKQALELIEQFEAASPVEHQAAAGIKRHALLGMQAYTVLYNTTMQHIQDDPYESQWMWEAVSLLGKMGRLIEAEQAVKHYNKTWKDDDPDSMPPEVEKDILEQARLAAAMASGDIAKVSRVLSSMPDDMAVYVRKFVKGDLKGTLDWLNENPESAYAEDYLQVFNAASMVGDDATAVSAFDAAMTLLEGGAYSDYTLAQHLKAADRMTLDEIMDFEMSRDELPTVFITLAMRVPQHRQALLDHARKLNVDLDFNALMNRQVLEQAASSRRAGVFVPG